jgi:non-lysosomal glucosylceramidase
MSAQEQPTNVSRREFLAAGTGAVALSLMGSCCEPAAARYKVGTHHIPPDKNLDKAWLESLFAKGQSKVYRGDELTCIGMPIGGICAGQLYLRGDGTLAEWSIFNHDHFTGYGETCYRTYTPPSPLQQGFALWLQPEGGPSIYRTLDKAGFPQVEFIGEYPLGKVRYIAADNALPADVSLEAFSPFIPLNAKESGIPGTVLRYRVRNTSLQKVEAALGGWLQNIVCARHVGKFRGQHVNRLMHMPGMTVLELSATEEQAAKGARGGNPEVFADFESGTYGGWTKTGTAFGDRPATGTFPHQQPVSGFGGKYLVNSFTGGDQSVGTLTSPEFTINRQYINFKIGGGNFAGKTCMNLRVGGKAVRTATGKNNEKLDWDYWEVSELQGQKARLEIVDQATGGWGHINVDDIQFADTPPEAVRQRRLRDQADFGTMALTLLEDHGTGAAGTFEGFRTTGELPRRAGGTDFFEYARCRLGQPDCTGGVATRFTLAPGESKDVTFLVTWHFAGGEHGRAYGRRFADAVEVARHLRDNLDELTRLTHLFHDTYYDSTLPHWFLDRTLMPISTLATDTVQWWRNGRFWAWEGVGCCNGTCTHVWNYAQGMARLFPELERSARTMQDLGPALDPKTGRVGFRGEDPHSPYAADGQCGTVLKCYREHLMSKDDSFLKENWPRIKKVMEYAIARDGNADGILEDKQWNTFDLDFVGPNTFVGALYLAALHAAARMADLQRDHVFAERCRSIADKGGKWTAEHLFNGEYYIQRIPAGAPPKYQYGEGCLADHLFGQNWANQVDLGGIYPAEQVRAALHSIYRYNWAPDIAAQNKAHPPQRWFVQPGEAGLFECTWPKEGRMQEPVLYRDEVWTGTEYQVASHLLYEGMIREGLSVVRGIHDRYDGKRHNPWNEVECGDHYARALASWGCLLALAGFLYDGPAGRLGFAPRWQANEFKAFFTAAEGWGSLRQTRMENSQRNEITVKHGRAELKELRFAVVPAAPVTGVEAHLGEKRIEIAHKQEGTQVRISLNAPVVVEAGQTLGVTLKW